MEENFGNNKFKYLIMSTMSFISDNINEDSPLFFIAGLSFFLAANVVLIIGIKERSNQLMIKYKDIFIKVFIILFLIFIMS